MPRFAVIFHLPRRFAATAFTLALRSCRLRSRSAIVFTLASATTMLFGFFRPFFNGVQATEGDERGRCRATTIRVQIGEHAAIGAPRPLGVSRLDDVVEREDRISLSHRRRASAEGNLDWIHAMRRPESCFFND